MATSSVTPPTLTTTTRPRSGDARDYQLTLILILPYAAQCGLAVYEYSSPQPMRTLTRSSFHGVIVVGSWMTSVAIGDIAHAQPAPTGEPAAQPANGLQLYGNLDISIDVSTKGIDGKIANDGMS